ncbi:MAG: type II secretion system F family protein [Hyphomicrobiales bacterium]
MNEQIVELLVILLIAAAVGGLVLTLLYPYFSGERDMAKRIDNRVVGKQESESLISSIRGRLANDSKDTRRRQIQDTLKQLEETARKQKKRLTTRALIAQSGLDITLRTYWIAAVVVGIVLGFAVLIVGAPPYVALLAMLAGILGLPRWFLNYMRRRREESFLREFADAIDIMVRSLKAGLPVSDSMRVIASESPAPVGPEFLEVVEGQRVGISIDQGLERMYESIPLAEVNFLSIVMAIQMKTGGNLAEALNNLSKVLRDRKKMKQKIKAVSQEAKSSAMIIGALPFVICGGMAALNPSYLTPLWDTHVGNIMIAGSLIWMLIGTLVMRQMINFEI